MRRWTLSLLATAGLLVAAVPPVGDHAIEVVPDGSAVPLAAPSPDWYTDALHQQVLEAAPRGEGVDVPDGAEVPASALAFTGIRPGSWMVFPAGCTLNFVFGSVPGGDEASAPIATDGLPLLDDEEAEGDSRRGGPPEHARSGVARETARGGAGSTSGSGGGTYIGTAGHCTEVGDEVTIVAAPGVLMNIGTTVRSVDEGVGDDFALIEIHDEMVEHVTASTAYFGGPTGEGDPQFGDLVGHAGHGVGIGTGGTPRAGLVVYRGDGDTARSDAFAWDGAAAPGDSGSFVVDLDGTSAAGNLTHLVVGGPYVPGNVAGTSIDRMLEIAGRPLATAPAGPDPAS